jgi:hypothetical protein
MERMCRNKFLASAQRGILESENIAMALNATQQKSHRPETQRTQVTELTLPGGSEVLGQSVNLHKTISPPVNRGAMATC